MSVVARRASRQVNAGGVRIGGGAPVSVQTMTNAAAEDVQGTLRQIAQAAEAGCELVRCAVPTVKHIETFSEVVKGSPLPVVADIHFDWRIAVGALEAGAAKIRINPGNMEDWNGIHKVLDAAKAVGAPIRIGLNGGSVRHKNPNDARSLEEAICEEALSYAARFEEYGFSDIVLSLKLSDPLATIRANRFVAGRCDYPLHVGVTEAGLEEDALIKSAIGIGSLLAEGIGDTIRLSFTGEPVNEVIAGKRLLRAAGLLRDQPEIISCPTCGRCRNRNLPELVKQVKDGLRDCRKGIKVAVMGCEVNGPGEAKDADVGLAACGGGRMVLFCKGEELCRVDASGALKVLLDQIEKL